jgi:hypothetical protein
MPRLSKRDRLIAAFELTPSDIKLIQQHAQGVWNECAYDVFAALAEEKSKSINSVTVPRAVVMEIALDAGRLEQSLGMGHNGHWTDRCKLSEAGRRFVENHYDGDARVLMDILIKEQFTFRTYGM